MELHGCSQELHEERIAEGEYQFGSAGKDCQEDSSNAPQTLKIAKCCPLRQACCYPYGIEHGTFFAVTGVRRGVLSDNGSEDDMTSKRERVMLAGRLSGMGHDVSCTVHADKVTLGGTDLYEYARLHITGEPLDLPDGQYTLSFDGRTIPIQRFHSAWISRN